MTERIKKMRGLLASRHLAGWRSWRPNELVLQSAHPSHWSRSVSLFLAGGERIFSAPELDPDGTVPEGVIVIHYRRDRVEFPDPLSKRARRCGARLEDDVLLTATGAGILSSKRTVENT